MGLFSSIRHQFVEHNTKRLDAWEFYPAQESDACEAVNRRSRSLRLFIQHMICVHVFYRKELCNGRM